MLQSSGALGNVSTGSEIPQNSGAKGMLPFVEGNEISCFGKGSIDSTLTNGGMDGVFGELNNEGGALGQSITGQLEKSLGHHVANQPGGEPGLSLEHMGGERFQAPPTVAGDVEVWGHFSAKPSAGKGG
jgi:hypothetical protein